MEGTTLKTNTNRIIRIHCIGIIYLLIVLITMVTSSTEAYFVDANVTSTTIHIGNWDNQNDFEDPETINMGE